MTLPTTMRAVQYTEYGASNVLTINQVPVPAPGPGEVLVFLHQIHYQSINKTKNDNTPLNSVLNQMLKHSPSFLGHILLEHLAE